MQLPSPLEKIDHPLFEDKGVTVLVKRDDQIHPQISGNKWRKLKYNIEKAKHKGHDTVLTFGGAYSNHILATAVACKEHKLRSIGVIRGDEVVNPTLEDAWEAGMELHFVPRDEYREKDEDYYKYHLRELFGSFYLVPEGGSNYLGVTGAMDIVDEIDQPFTHILTACGTGTTMAGLLASVDNLVKVIGVPVLKGDFMADEVSRQLYSFYLETSTVKKKMEQATFSYDHHFGGYAKYTDELISFMRDVTGKGFPQLDPIYTGKSAFALFDMIRSGAIPKGSKVVFVHTGGLQGIRGFEDRFGITIYRNPA